MEDWRGVLLTVLYSRWTLFREKAQKPRGSRTHVQFDAMGYDKVPKGRMPKKTPRALWMVPRTPDGRTLATQGRAEVNQVEAETELKSSRSHPGGLQVNYNAEYSVGTGM